MVTVAEIIEVVKIGLVVGCFLFNTSRILKGIELCKECAILLNNKAFEREPIAFNSFYTAIYETLLIGYRLINDHTSAIECGRKLLVVLRRCRDRVTEGKITFQLATLHRLQSQFKDAKCFYEEALGIMIETGDRKGEGSCYVHLGTVCQSLGKYEKAQEYLQKALRITREDGDKQGEAANYEIQGNVFRSVGEYDKAETCLQKALVINKEIANKKGEASCYADLGAVFKFRSKYVEAEECYKKALAITKEVGDRKLEAVVYGNLGTLFQSLGEYIKAKEYLQKAIGMRVEIDDKEGEALCYANLGAVFQSLAEYVKAEKYLHRALTIRKEIGDRQGEATCYGNLGTMFAALGDYTKAEEYLNRALAIDKEIGDRRGEAIDYGNLGTAFQSRGENVKAREYHEKALEISKEIGNIEGEFELYAQLSWDLLNDEGNVHEAFLNLLRSINRSEEMRSFLSDSDEFKISFLDTHVFPYEWLSFLFCSIGSYIRALYVVELGRARALADLMSAQYSVEKHISVNPQTWVGIEKIMKESDRTCLYISHFQQVLILLWILKAHKPVLFRQIYVDECIGNSEENISRVVDDVFRKETFRRFYLPHVQGGCEDRSLVPSNGHPTHESSQEDVQFAALRPEESKDKEDENQQPAELPSLDQCYKMFIAPVADLLGDERELIIVPDRTLYKVPFAALSDERGKPLSETFWIRIVPSLTTLKLIQDSPTDYHSQNGALIVGDPEVGEVFYKGHVKKLPPLPSARKEAEMIG